MWSGYVFTWWKYVLQEDYSDNLLAMHSGYYYLQYIYLHILDTLKYYRWPKIILF